MALFKTKKINLKSTVLSDRFIVPPFSVFNTHQTYWRNRDKMWYDLGFKGTNGRITSNNGLTYDNRRMDNYTGKKDRNFNGTSTFSPTLCEVVYKWFTIPNSTVFDPFAGGITRGAIASILGHNYIGTDINPIQVKSNEEEYKLLKDKFNIEGNCRWINNDCLNIIDNGMPVDFIFTCPPYYNLEKYTDLPNDLSNKSSYKEFINSYVNYIKKCYNILKDDSFMVWVVSDVRDKKTTEYYGLVADTIKACQYSGFKFYNEIILYNDTGNLAIVSGDYLKKARKVGRQHQSVLVFYKGNIDNLKAKFSEVEIDGKCW